MAKPTVLCFSGADPCGGAGTQADIEAIASMGGHAVTVTTALTVQNSQGVESYQASESDHLEAQAKALIADMTINAIKTGMLASKAVIKVVEKIINQQPNVAVVIDPVMASNSGNALSDNGYANALRDTLLPLAQIITPNLPELYQLAPNANNISDACNDISSLGCEYVLVTGAHDNDSKDTVINRLYQNGELINEQTWDRLPGEYHGSGCTLAASLAAQLANNKSIIDAVTAAQDYTWHSLKFGVRLGKGQIHPDRFFWRKDNLPYD